MENQAPNSPFHRIFILGGHALAVNYALTLAKGRESGEIAFDGLFCVTDDPKAKAFSVLGPDRVISRHPAAFVLDYAQDGDPWGRHPADTLVPDHTAKHVMLDVLMRLAAKTLPNARIALTPFETDFTAPFLYKGENGALWAVSHATWTCPPDCDEPAVCPHIKAPRDWNLFESIPRLFDSLPDAEYAKYRFGCAPLYKEISQIPLSKITEALRNFETRLASAPPRKVIVATHSHCHGILGTFAIS